jgi:spore maturation protein CgeB
MKIALLAEYYPNYLSEFHRKNYCQLSKLGYSEHQERLFSDFFGSFISYRNYFRRIGHQCELIVANYSPLQEKWLHEQGLPLTSAKEEIVLRQLAGFKPDVFFMGSMFGYYGNFLRRVSLITKNIFTWISCPIPAGIDFSHVKCILSSIQEFVVMFQAKGQQAEWLRAAFDPDIIEKLQDVKKAIPISFVGSLSPATHRRRLEMVEALIEAGIPLQIWGCRYSGGLLRKSWRAFRRSPIDACHLGEVWGIEMYRTLARSQITLNTHVDVAKRHNMGGNMRLFEATGCGALLITDDAEDAATFFCRDEEIITYRSSDDLIDKARYYLENPIKASAIARAGQKACLERHGYDKRIRELESIFLKYLE